MNLTYFNSWFWIKHNWYYVEIKSKIFMIRIVFLYFSWSKLGKQCSVEFLFRMKCDFVRYCAFLYYKNIMFQMFAHFWRRYTDFLLSFISSKLKSHREISQSRTELVGERENTKSITPVESNYEQTPPYVDFNAFGWPIVLCLIRFDKFEKRGLWK